MADKSKRHLSPSSGGGGDASAKRARVEQDDEEPTGRALVPAGAPQPSAAGKKSARSNGGVPRTSSLAAPTMRLTGHVGEVFAAAFSPGDSGGGDGNGNVLLASAGYDRSVLLWRASGECDNVAALHGHKNAVLSLAWLGGGSHDGAVLLSSSADGTARAWSVERETQIKRAAEHGKSVVNCVAAASGRGAPPIFVTAGDDGVARVWDMRVRRSVARLGEIEEEEEEEEDNDEDDDDDDDDAQQRRRQRRRRQRQRRRTRQTAGGFPLLACAINPAADVAYTAGIDNIVRAWDLRKTSTPSLTLVGHSDTITSLALKPGASSNAAPTHLLSNSSDGTLRCWDVRPFAPAERCSRAFVGAAHSLERNLLRCCWSRDDGGARVAAGSSDGTAYVWDSKTAALEYALPGHSGSVNDVCFHPTEPVIASASSDGSLFVGELAS